MELRSPTHCCFSYNNIINNNLINIIIRTSLWSSIVVVCLLFLIIHLLAYHYSEYRLRLNWIKAYNYANIILHVYIWHVERKSEIEYIWCFIYFISFFILKVSTRWSRWNRQHNLFAIIVLINTHIDTF